MGKVDTAVQWALSIANDNSHGYDQSGRWGPDYDCSSLIIQAYENAGIPVKTNGATYTGNMYSVFISCGFSDVTSMVNLSTGAGLKYGDVLLNTTHHTELALSETQMVGAHINEYGEVTGGKTGDQTDNEISVRSYYNYPWDYVLRYADEDFVMPDPISGNRYLSQAEMENNAKYIWYYLSGKGWTINAVAGMLGNMQTESTINPGIWESLDSGNTSGGYGLVQWTPATKLIYWCDNNGLNYQDIAAQLQRIEYELANGIQYYPTKNYPETFAEFKKSTKDPYYLGMAFLANYERPAVANQPKRGQQAEKWYEFLTGLPAPGQTKTKRTGLPLCMMLMTTRRKV